MIERGVKKVQGFWVQGSGFWVEERVVKPTDSVSENLKGVIAAIFFVLDRHVDIGCEIIEK